MRRTASAWATGLLLAGCWLVAAPVAAEVVDEIVAIINGDILTKSDLEDQEQVLISEAYSRLTGSELDQQVEGIRGAILMELIDNKIVLHRGQAHFDLERMASAYFDAFLEQQGIASEEEAGRLLAQEGMTVEEFKQRMLERFAPDELVRMEVRGRISIGDKEVEAYYAEHPDEFIEPLTVTIREIVLLADTEAKREERRAEAERVREQALEQDFETLAKAVSEAGTRDDGGLMGPLSRGDLSQQLEEVTFGLAVGEVSQTLETPYGFHLIRIESRSSPDPIPLEEVKEDLRRHLGELRFITEYQEYIVKARKDAEWCVKSGYRDRVPGDVGAETCDTM